MEGLIFVFWGLIAGAIVGGASGYALLFFCPLAFRALASCVTACLPSFAWALTLDSGGSVAGAADMAFASRFTVLSLTAWIVVLASYRAVASQWRRPDASAQQER